MSKYKVNTREDNSVFRIDTIQKLKVDWDPQARFSGVFVGTGVIEKHQKTEKSVCSGSPWGSTFSTSRKPRNSYYLETILGETKNKRYTVITLVYASERLLRH